MYTMHWTALMKRKPKPKLVWHILRSPSFWDVVPRHWLLSDIPRQTGSLETSGINRPVTRCHISEGRRPQLLHCESWITLKAYFMGSWAKCMKWKRNDEVVFAAEIILLLIIRKMVDYSLLEVAIVLVYTDRQQRTYYYSLTLYAQYIVLQYVCKPTRCTKFLWLDFIFY